MGITVGGQAAVLDQFHILLDNRPGQQQKRSREVGH